MDSETPIIRYIAGAVGVVLICFCVGYFLLGPRPGGATPSVAEASPAPEPSTLVVRGPAPKLTVLETTGADTPRMEAQRNETREATPAPTPTPLEEATPAPSGKNRRDGDEPIKIPAPKSEEPAPDEEVKPADPPAESSKPAEGGADTVYRVRMKDSFGSHDDAEQLASELKGRGFSATVMPGSKGKFEVQIGAYKDKKRAEEKQKELEKNSYKTRIADKEIDLDKTEPAGAGESKSSEKEAEKSKDKSTSEGR